MVVLVKGGEVGAMELEMFALGKIQSRVCLLPPFFLGLGYSMCAPLSSYIGLFFGCAPADFNLLIHTIGLYRFCIQSFKSLNNPNLNICPFQTYLQRGIETCADINIIFNAQSNKSIYYCSYNGRGDTGSSAVPFQAHLNNAP
jgi:hypothetical protein